MALGGPQVLADRQDLHVVLTQFAERLDHLIEGLAEADHESGFGGDFVTAVLLGVAQDPLGPFPGRAAAGDRVEAGNHLHIVVEDVRPLGDHLGQWHLRAPEVRRQHLDLRQGRLTSDLPDHAHEGRGAVVGKVVAVHARDDGVAQAHLRHAARHPGRLQRVVPRRLPGLDIAETAPAGAGVPEDHEGRCAPLPALPDVRTGRLTADRVQVLGLDQLAELPIPRSARRGHLEPRRFTRLVRQGVGPQDAQDIADPAGVGT